VLFSLRITPSSSRSSSAAHVGGPPDGKGKKAMIELVIAACLATGECKESRLTYDARDVSLMTCMVSGQAEIARWQRKIASGRHLLVFRCQGTARANRD
jgi:hypothetical protein